MLHLTPRFSAEQDLDRALGLMGLGVLGFMDQGLGIGV